MRITDVLRVEHRLLRAMMELMSQWVAGPTPADALRERATMLSTALEAHAQREEKQLFEPLRPRSETARHLVDRMELVHDEVRGLFEEIASGREPKERLWTVLDLTEAHFVREEEEVFPLAEEVIALERLVELGEEPPG